eukprot:CAMPEP_0197622266 /NCGR_PEP_ID=MMETSP1338-20131121/2631_1 /TAXON_ID=43686 ORGANISM="Pelagodinium beii, Strain RCC1491" /NCGR_SAMPLE_ID=MMETSP1338 /ASSEMBLY_ACC=CAM_ASM_000754 /LENGTH=222 /DNA_ID=CAMNT_0043191971 /DNA_START=21 /DNA_END=689 /DNA_ORIENTATION=+
MAPTWSWEHADPEQVKALREQLPATVKNLRACLQCRIILSKEQFFKMGCPNCKGSLNMKESEGRVVACTTSHFQGFISMVKPGAFVSRFNGLERRPPGCYALTVHGSIPEKILAEGSEYEPSEIGGEEAVLEEVEETGAPTGAASGSEKAAATEAESEDGGMLDGLLDSPLVPPSPSLPTPSPSEKRKAEVQAEAQKRRKVEEAKGAAGASLLEPEEDTEFK